MRIRWSVCVAGLAALAVSLCRAGDIGFPEDFALAKDRAEALKLLIPGTEDHYYYSCIHYQNTGKLDAVDKLLTPWIKRHNRTPRVIEIENRQALLRYATDPKRSLEFIRQRLNLTFQHQRALLDQKPQLPTELNQNLIAREPLAQRALQQHPGTLDGFEDRALEWAATADLGVERLRNLLGRLKHPDYPNLPSLVVAELNDRQSRGFGSIEIHRNLLLAQLEDCLKLKPDLRNQAGFVTIYLTKLRPNPDVDWRNDTAARQAYLDRVWSFVATLDPAHNSLKAHVLYHRLIHDRALGIHDKERFMAYLKLPRRAGYVKREYMNLEEHRRFPADLAADFQGVTQLVAVRDDEPLVRSYFEHFFVAEDDTAPYEPYVDDVYLKERLAETKIVNGLGDMEKWYSLLPPATYQALKDRVDLDFAPTNKNFFDVEEQVALDLHVKNVKTLIVKVFELNTVNYYRTLFREIDTAIDLDGLVANEEKTQTFDEPPLRRVKRHFEFPQIARRGCFVIEFIGNGKSSRALVRKGKLRFLAETTTAGHAFTVMDEANRTLPQASLYLAGHEFRADQDGEIAVPFTHQPGRQPIVLVNQDFATLEFFNHEAENYALEAGFFVDRESLLTRAKATVLVRPALMLNGTPATLSVLEDVRLLITSTDADGVNTTKEVKDFKLYEDRESTYEFQVPANLASISFTVRARVQNLSRNKKEDLAASRAFQLNGIDATDKIEDLHLGRATGAYLLDLLGKTGEPRPDRPVEITLKHRDFRDVVVTSLATDARGRIVLGPLADIDWIAAKGPDGTGRRWELVEERHTYPQTIDGRAFETIRIPYMGRAREPRPSELSLLEVRAGTYVADRFPAIGIKDGFVELAKLPPGDYAFRFKPLDRVILVRMTEGEARGGYVLSKYRQLEVKNPAPLQIASVAAGAEAVTVTLGNASKLARVHVIATRFAPEYSAYDMMNAFACPEPIVIRTPAPATLYVIGRDIGDEYRYILERKYATKFPGIMLARPSLLLNPWAIRSTQTGTQEAQQGTAFGRAAERPGAAREKAEAAGEEGGPGGGAGYENLDFVGETSVLLANLRPDALGVVAIKRADLGGHHQVHIVAVDPLNVAYRELSLPEAPRRFADLRLAAALDPKNHYTEQKQVTVVPAGGEFVIGDIATSDFQVYDSLESVYSLFTALTGNSTLAEFGFIRNWPKLKPEEKREQYTKHASHELNFFLSRKDPKFFEEVIGPYLRNKFHKTFLDRWLLGDPLDDYLKPWAYGRLNIVERILLGHRIKAEFPNEVRHVQDLFDLLPPDLERLEHLFRTALKGRALETADAFGVEKAKGELDKAQKDALRRLEVEDRAAAPDAAPAAPPAPATAAATREPRKMSAAKGRAAGVGGGRAPAEKAAAEEEAEVLDESLAEGRAYRMDAARRDLVRQLFQPLDTTMEWVENNYYHLPIEQQNENLITVNGFWLDFAKHDGTKPFLSRNVAEASRSFAEMMLALAVLDLPFEPAAHTSAIDKARFTLRPGSVAIVYHKEIKGAEPADEKAPILVSQNFYRIGDRYYHVNNEQFDKYVTEEFLVHTGYGCHLVVTNPTSSKQKLDILIQVPRGAIPIAKGQYTKSVHVDLEPYRTWTADYFFYFPAPGAFAHYPVHVAKNEKLIGFAPAFAFKVVEKPSVIDKKSWEYLSQHGSEDDVIEFLNANNLGRIDLEKIAWRVQGEPFFKRVVALLDARHAYHPTLWSYSVKHNALPQLREFLKHTDAFVNQCGAAIESAPLTIDPVERKAYQHMEYWPLVNARAHQLGKARKILNDRFCEQYLRLMNVLAYRPALDDGDLMSVTCYLLLQDRVEEALAFFGRVKPENLASRLQHDCFQAYLDLATGNVERARALAQKHANEPVDRWRNLFAAAAAQLDEIQGKAAAVVDKEDRTQTQTKLAATEASFDFQVEAKQVSLAYQNLAECRVNYYLMDIELLFSRNPFVSEYSNQFAYIRPNESIVMKLDPARASVAFPIPERFGQSNVLVEIAAAGVKKAKPSFSNALAIQVIENYAQLKVTHAATGKPLPKVYVKAYARMGDGAVRFFKDGYTDLRGRFDYGSLSTNELDNVKRFSMLILSEEHGAAVREADPPKR